MSLIDKANKIINERSEEKERQYGPMTEGMQNASSIALDIQNAVDRYSTIDDMKLASFRYLYALKLSREKYNHKEDNMLDAIAYRIAEVNALRELRKEEPYNVNSFELRMKELNAPETIASSNISLLTAVSGMDYNEDEYYKLVLVDLIKDEIAAIGNNNELAREIAILKQVKILDKINDVNS